MEARGEPDLWATHPALQVDISHGHRPGPRLDHWAARPVVTLTFAIRSRMTLSSGTHELPALPLPCGLSANTTVSWHGRTLFNLSPPSLGRRYPASSLLWGDPTSPRASATRRCLRTAYRHRSATDSWRSPEVRMSNVSRSTHPLPAWSRSDIGLRVARHTQTRPACIGVHLRSVPRFASGFHPTRPHGKDECDRWGQWTHLVQLPLAHGCLRQAP